MQEVLAFPAEIVMNLSGDRDVSPMANTIFITLVVAAVDTNNI